LFKSIDPHDAQTKTRRAERVECVIECVLRDLPEVGVAMHPTAKPCVFELLGAPRRGEFIRNLAEPRAVLRGGDQQFAFIVHQARIGFEQVNEFSVEGYGDSCGLAFQSERERLDKL